ncbi:hypothetical protein JCM5350_000377 [Sporobolomyces pararoseus]
MPPIGAAPRIQSTSPRSSPIVPVQVDFVDTGPAFKRRLKSFLARDPPPDRHAAYLESVGHEHLVSRSKPVSPTSTLSYSRHSGPTPSEPKLSSSSSSEPARRPGVALALSVSSEHLPERRLNPSRPKSTIASRSTSALVQPPPPPPNCPLPPVPPVAPSHRTTPPSPRVSLESAFDANLLQRFSSTARSSQSSNFHPAFHERIFTKSKDLLNLSVSSIWSLSAEDARTSTTGDSEEMKARKSSSLVDGTKISLDGLSISSPSISIAEDEDLLSSPTDTNRPSLSPSYSSDSTGTEKIKWLTVFDKEPNLKLSPPGQNSPSISPRTQPTTRFDSNVEVFGRNEEEEEGDEECEEEEDVDHFVLRNTPGAFCYMTTEQLSLSQGDQQKLEKMMKQRVRQSGSHSRGTM